MKAVLLVLGLFLCLASAQLQFTANIQLRHPFMAGGVVDGTIQYSWALRAYRLFYTKQSYQEIYQYNSARGYAPTTTTDRPFLNQWVYKSGQTCACETGPLDSAMSQFFVAPSVQSNYTSSGVTKTINGVLCNEYKAITNTPGDVVTLWWDVSGAKVCRAVFDDLREITFTSVVATAPASSIFTPPAGCKCGQPVDIAIVLDRSGSISQTEFGNQKAFVVGFTSMFSYGPFGANLALVHFNTPAWTTLTMPEGISDSNVQNSVNALVCCTTSSNMASSCCCCGTSVSSGMRLGADQLKLGRARVEKIMLVVSDGYHNHDIYGKECAQNSAACRSDLQAAYDYSVATVPGVKVYAIGVGSDRDVSTDELVIIAGGYKERVLRYTDFTNLATNSLDLVARACQENLNPCGGCCGFCVCGQCVAPDACDQTSFCSENAVSGVCCKGTPRKCDPGTGDLCLTYTCDETQKACITNNVACKPDATCFTYKCLPATGLCESTLRPGCGSQAECTSNATCDDNNKCTLDICGPDQMCHWESITASCDDGNACTVDECVPSTGCKNTPLQADYCDDQSNCTIDSCDAKLGCVHVNVTCTDDNLCTDDICDPFKGCLSTPRVCANDGSDKCKLFFCNNGTCASRDADGCAPPVLITIGVLSTAAIIGIVIAIILVVIGAGAGGAYAYSQAAASGSAAPVANNPLYVGGGNSGTNPLFRGNH